MRAFLHKLAVGLSLLLVLGMVASTADAQSRRRSREQGTHGKKGKEGEKKAGCPMGDATR